MSEMASALDNGSGPTTENGHLDGFWPINRLAITAIAPSILMASSIAPTHAHYTPSPTMNFVGMDTLRNTETVTGESSTSASFDEKFDTYFQLAPLSSEFDGVQLLIRSFADLEDGWEGPDSFAPSDDVIDDAIIVIQLWNANLPHPEPVVEGDGNITIELYDQDDFSVGGIEFIGQNQAVYSVVSKTERILTGRFLCTDSNAIRVALQRMAIGIQDRAH